MKGRILLLMTPHYSIYQNIIKNLELMGYEVLYFESVYTGFKYKNWFQKLTNFIRKTFLNDKNYKKQLKESHLEKSLVTLLDCPENYFDYTLVIRPDAYTPKMMEYINKISKKTIAYQWDGMKRFQHSEALIDSFDVFGVFDSNDFEVYSIKHKNLFLTHNFYFDFVSVPQAKTIDLCYIGAEQNDRVQIINYISSLTNATDFVSYFRIYTERRSFNQESPIIINNKLLSYQEVERISSQSRCILDIKFHAHDGLSFRFFEALHFSQKTITDNPTVKNYDFYHPNNILVVEDWFKLTKEQLASFLEKPYTEIPECVKSKYSFEEWFKTIISIETDY
ncbi:hypothetical protein JSO54_07920 [Riemerella anatipestifer]|uniref:hypothetical protein n=1 Tax=Riemerella anatipestifer TaxID=34085 RepID=UPI001374B997|nr:hypothetical protein [Riemerella anatipestifer]